MSYFRNREEVILEEYYSEKKYFVFCHDISGLLIEFGDILFSNQNGDIS